MPPAIESDSPPGEEPMTFPPSVSINRLSDKFKEALGRAEKAPEPLPEKPAAKPTEKSEQPKETKEPLKQDKQEPKKPKIPHEHFEALETQRNEFKTKWEQAEERAKLNEARAKEIEGKIPTDYDQLKSRISNYEMIEKKFLVEHSDEFKRAYTDKISAGIEEIKEAAGAKSEELLELIALPPSAKRDAAISELTEDMASYNRDAIHTAMREVRKLKKQRAAELDKPTENYKQLQDFQAQQATKEKVARMEALERAARITASEAAKQSVHFQKLEGNDEHNQRVIENEKMLREFTTSDLAPEDHAKLSMWAVRGIRAQQTDALKDALIQKLQAELKAISDSNPSVNGGGKGGEKPKPMTAAEKFKKAITEGIPNE